jgi:4'-phosphopantetheinyl transferase EntD
MRSPVLEKLLPADVIAVEAFGDPAEATLFPEEAALIAAAVDKRRLEFTTGRHCARAALAGLGLAPAPLLPGPRGEPPWPDGVVGSITHCAGYRASAVARASAFAAVGIDAEPHHVLPEGVLEAIALEQELAADRELARRAPGVHWDRLLFCAKEAAYKAWFPTVRRVLEFTDAAVTVDPDKGSFSARLLVPALLPAGSPAAVLTGRWLVDRGLVVTAITLPHPCAPDAGASPLPAGRQEHR